MENNTNKKFDKQNEQDYLKVRKAKADVERFLENYGGIVRINDILDKIQDLSPMVRMVFGSGLFSHSDEGKLIFSMPATAKVMRYIAKSRKAYDNGYTKVTVLVHVEEDGNKSIAHFNRYEINADTISGKHSDSLLAVKDIKIHGEDAGEEMIEAIHDEFKSAAEGSENGSVTLYEMETIAGMALVEDDKKINKTDWGWTTDPVLRLVRPRNGEDCDYVIILPPCERL